MHPLVKIFQTAGLLLRLARMMLAGRRAPYPCARRRAGRYRIVVPESVMPTLFRFLFFCAVIAGSIYGTRVALVTFVEPTTREVTIRIPSERVNPQP
jgi:hypothetical protein